MRSRFWISLFGIWILLFGISGAATVDELKESIQEREGQISEIEAEIEEYQRQIDVKVAEVGTLKNEILRLEALLKKLNAEIRLTQSKIQASQLTLEKLNIEIGDKSEEIEEQKEALGEILRSIYESESESLVEILLKHRALSDFFGNLRQIENLEAAVGKDLEVLKTLKKELEEREAQELAAKKKLDDLSLELKDRRAIEEAGRQNKNQLLKITKNKEAEYQKLLREREKQRASIIEEIREIEDELRLLIDPSSLPAPRPGVLAWPLAAPKITQGFGRTDFALNTDVYGEKNHNGIDLKASIGTPILSAEDGVVKAAGNSDLICPGGSYGKWILIEHPNRLATLYAHLSHIRILTDSNVARGDIIGYSGDPGYTTGPHLHFTVYDARTVQIKPSRVCGLLPYGGYLDPMVYL